MPFPRAARDTRVRAVRAALPPWSHRDVAGSDRCRSEQCCTATRSSCLPPPSSPCAVRRQLCAKLGGVCRLGPLKRTHSNKPQHLQHALVAFPSPYQRSRWEVSVPGMQRCDPIRWPQRWHCGHCGLSRSRGTLWSCTHPLCRAALSQEQHSMTWVTEAVTDLCARSMAEMGPTQQLQGVLFHVPDAPTQALV